MPWKYVVRCLSRGKAQGKLFVFIFHRVLGRPDALLGSEPDQQTFDWMVRYISRTFNVLTFGEAMSRLQQGDLPPSAACITFDDGYQDNYSVALPVLQRHGIKATFFIATGFLGGGRMWNDDVIEAIRATESNEVDWSDLGLGHHVWANINQRRESLNSILSHLKYLPHPQRAETARKLARRAGVAEHSELMMNHDEVRALRAAGMEIGGHTRTHPILSGLSDEQAEIEIVEGKKDLEEILGQAVDVFAYPNGNPERDLSARDAELISKAGYRAAATTAWGIATTGTDPFMIPRFTPWDRSYNRFAARTVMTLFQQRGACSTPLAQNH